MGRWRGLPPCAPRRSTLAHLPRGCFSKPECSQRIMRSVALVHGDCQEPGAVCATGQRPRADPERHLNPTAAAIVVTTVVEHSPANPWLRTDPDASQARSEQLIGRAWWAPCRIISLFLGLQVAAMIGMQGAHTMHARRLPGTAAEARGAARPAAQASGRSCTVRSGCAGRQAPSARSPQFGKPAPGPSTARPVRAGRRAMSVRSEAAGGGDKMTVAITGETKPAHTPWR